MNGMIFRSFRKRNRFQKNTNTIYSEYSYSRIVPKEHALSWKSRCDLCRRTESHTKRSRWRTSHTINFVHLTKYNAWIFGRSLLSKQEKTIFNHQKNQSFKQICKVLRIVKGNGKIISRGKLHGMAM